MGALGTGLLTVGVSRALLVGAAVGLAVVGVRSTQAETGPVGRPFFTLLWLLAATALCLGITAGAGTANKVIWLGTNLAIPVAVLAVSCRYYGIALFRSRPRAAGVLAPLVAGGAGSLLVILGTVRQSPGSTPPVEALAGFSPVVYEAATTLGRLGRYYSFALVLVAVGIVLVNVQRYDHLDVRLAGALAFVGGWPWLGNFVVPEVTATFGAATSLGVLAGGYVSSFAVSALAVGPLGLFESSPAAGNIGPRRALDSMDDAVIITDSEDRILRVNDATCDTFGTTPAASAGRPLATVLGRSSAELTGVTSVDTDAGTREFFVTRSPVTDGQTVSRGTVFVLRDVTRRQSRQQRLEVLNRVLRHNLRNDATSIIGRAQLISDGDGGEGDAEEIVETTRGLVGVAESARDIDQMMAATAPADAVALDPIVQRATEAIGDSYPAVEITTAVPAEATVAASKQVVETVLKELLENAAEHNDADQPYAVVSADQTGDGSVTLAVSDNGPGVPNHERAVLDAEGEDQLQHGSGLGFWAVHWGVTRLGGELAISEKTPRGTTVTVTLPATTASDSAAAVPGQAES